MPPSSRMYAGAGLLIAVLVVVLILCGLAFGGLYAHRGEFQSQRGSGPWAVGVRSVR
jgi:hypothetical protein